MVVVVVFFFRRINRKDVREVEVAFVVRSRFFFFLASRQALSVSCREIACFRPDLLAFSFMDLQEY